MKKTLQVISLFALLLVCHLSYGQNNMEDVVYLKNGGIMRGIIIEQIPNQSIKIQTKDRNVFVFKYDEIEKIAKENLPSDNYRNSFTSTAFKKRGFINITEIMYSPGVGSIEVFRYQFRNIDYAYGLRTVNGYQLNEHLSLGIGIGIDKYKIATLLPITFDTRITFAKGKVSPVLNVNAGYSIGLNNSQAGGFIINPSFGMKTYISKNTAYLLNVGYRWQAQKVIYWDRYSFLSTQKVFYQFITISTGFAF